MPMINSFVCKGDITWCYVQTAPRVRGQNDYGRAIFREAILTRYPEPTVPEPDTTEFELDGYLDRLIVTQIACLELW